MRKTYLQCFSLACIAMSGLSACGNGGSAEAQGEAPGGVSRAVLALETEKNIRYEYWVPTGVAAQSIAILGFNDVMIADRAEIKSPDGSHAPVAGSGAGTVQLGVSAKTGSILTTGNVFLQERAHVFGDLVTAKNFNHQSEFTVDGVTRAQTTVPTRKVTGSKTIRFTTGDRNVSLEPGQVLQTPVAPGGYDSLTIKQNAKLTLLAGDYYFGQINIEPGATIVFDNSAGTTFLYVGDVFNFKGKMVPKLAGAGIKLHSTFLGGGQVFVSGPFRGAIVAPNGSINLEVPPANEHHEGTFFGKSVRVAPDTLVIRKSLSSMIRSVKFSKSPVCPGESVTATVDAVDPSGDAQAPAVTINGVPGSTLTDQFFGAPGPRYVAVTARTADGSLESTLEQLMVASCPNASSPQPALVAEPDLFHPGQVVLSVANANSFDDGTAQYKWKFGDGANATTSVPTTNHDFTASVPLTALNKPFEVSVTVTRSGLADATGTRTLVIWNDYAVSSRRGALEPPAEPIDPRLSISGGVASASVKFKNLEPTVLSYNKRRVDVVPCDGDTAPAVGAVETISITVPATGEVTQSVQIPASLLSASTCGVTIHFWGATAAGAKAQTSVTLEMPPKASAAVPVDAHLNAMLNYLVDQGLVSSDRTIDEETISRLYRERKIRYSVATGTFYQTGPAPTPTSGSECDPDNPGTPPTGGNYSCQPSGTWTVESPGWVAGAHIVNALKGDALIARFCGGQVQKILGALNPQQMYTHSAMMTKNFIEIRQSTGAPDYLMAHPNGVVGQPTDGFQESALRYLWPGVITNSVDEAFSGGRELTDPDGTSYAVNGFAPGDVRCEGDQNIIYPRVVKPAPDHELTARPRLLNAAEAAKTISGHYRFSQFSNATDALYSDSDGPAAQDIPSSGSGFGAGLKMYGPSRTTCSSFLRYALQAAGADLDKDTDLPQKSDVTNHPAEGLFYYDANERLAAGNALYSATYNEVQYQIDLVNSEVSDYWWVGAVGTVGLGLVFGPAGAAVGLASTFAIGYFGTVFKWATDAPDDVANQITNCFSSDYCGEGAKDSENWQNPGEGYSVSPDNILDHYDAPDPVKSPNGVYGYSERMKYRGKRYHQVFKWMPAAGTRRVCGTVLNGTTPEANAQVEVQGIPGATQVSDADGKFCFDAIPGGNISVHAAKTIGTYPTEEQWEGVSCFTPDPGSEQWLAAKCSDFSVTNATPLAETDVTIKGPDAQYRKVQITATVSLRDADCYVSDTWGGPYTYFRTCTVGPNPGEQEAPLAEMGQYDLCASEVGMKITGKCTWQSKGFVKVDLTSQFYEAGAGSCGANDLEDTESTSFTVKPNGVEQSFPSSDLYLLNSGLCFTPIGIPWELDDEAWVSYVKAKNIIAD